MSEIRKWTNRQIQLLSSRLNFYQSLHSGKRAPTTFLQKHFVAVVQGEAAPRTDDERAYLAYLADKAGAQIAIGLFQRQQLGVKIRSEQKLVVSETQERPLRQTSTPPAAPKSKPKQRTAPIFGVAASPTPKKQKKFARFIDEPWGSREAWKRDRASWKRNH